MKSFLLLALVMSTNVFAARVKTNLEYDVFHSKKEPIYLRVLLRADFEKIESVFRTSKYPHLKQELVRTYYHTTDRSLSIDLATHGSHLGIAINDADSLHASSRSVTLSGAGAKALFEILLSSDDPEVKKETVGEGHRLSMFNDQIVCTNTIYGQSRMAPSCSFIAEK